MHALTVGLHLQGCPSCKELSTDKRKYGHEILDSLLAWLGISCMACFNLTGCTHVIACTLKWGSWAADRRSLPACSRQQFCPSAVIVAKASAPPQHVHMPTNNPKPTWH